VHIKFASGAMTQTDTNFIDTRQENTDKNDYIWRGGRLSDPISIWSQDLESGGFGVWIRYFQNLMATFLSNDALVKYFRHMSQSADKRLILYVNNPL